MTPSLVSTLKRALRQLETEQARIEKQIAAVRALLAGAAPSAERPARRAAVAAPAAKPRRTMSPKARKAAQARMKAYWAKKRAEAGKGK